MANISLTTACNRTCAFCFAASGRTGPRSAVHMDAATFDASLDFLVRSGIPEARLLGGEPTLHPEFQALVDRVFARGLRLMVFSGGLIPEAALRRLAAIPPDEVAVLLNVEPDQRPHALRPARLEAVCRRLGPRVTLGVTLASPSVRIGGLFDAIDRHGLRRTLRLGLAHPTLPAGNEYLRPRHYREVGRRVGILAEQARQRRVTIEFDCGWVPCMFSGGAPPDPAGQALGIGCRCSPIGDILPDGRVVSCYPLATLGAIPLTPALDAGRVRAAFQQQHSAHRASGLRLDCADCDWRARGECDGGCLAAGMQRQRGGMAATLAGGGA